MKKCYSVIVWLPNKEDFISFILLEHSMDLAMDKVKALIKDTLFWEIEEV